MTWNKAWNKGEKSTFTGSEIEREVQKFLFVSTLSDKTRSLYEWCLRTFFNWIALQMTDFEAIDIATVIRFLVSVPDWSNSTRHNMLAAIRTFYRWKWGANHPVVSARIRKVEPGPQRTLQEEEVAAVMAACDISTPYGVRDLAILALFLDTGMRSNELCNLEIRNLDLNKKRLSVLVKGGSWQVKIFSDHTKSLIENWLNIRDEHASPKTKTVFVSLHGHTPGQRMTTSGVLQLWKDIAQKAGIECFTTHALRRTFATLAIQNGAPTRLVQLAGGWKTLSMVERYTQYLRTDAMSLYSPVNHVMGLGHAQK